MKLMSAASLKSIDAYAIDNLGIPSTFLMDNAGAGVVEAALKLFPDDYRGNAAVFCGAGNNGGDGMSVARILKDFGWQVRCFLLGDADKLSDASRTMEKRLKARGGELEALSLDAATKSYCKSCGLIVDALVGIGLHSSLRPETLTLVNFINECPARKVSIDIPTGVDGDTGKLLGGAVRADLTVTFSRAMIGHIIQPGGPCCGKIRILDIGIPKDVMMMHEPSASLVTGFFVDKRMPVRPRDSHKGNFGKLLMISGSRGYTGAPSMAAHGALRAGAGIVNIATSASAYPIVASKRDEVIVTPLTEDENGVISYEARDILLKKLDECDVCLIGPGLGRSEGLTKLIFELITNSKKPLVIDADGINAVSENIHILQEADCPIIFTPHDGEFARLGGRLEDGNRCAAVSEFARKYNCVTVLKGYRTVTATPDGELYLNTTGNPGLSTGGSGDVLAGIITSLIGQGMPYKDATICAVWLHGKAGDLCAESIGEYGMLPSDVAEALPRLLKKFQTVAETIY